MNDELRSEIKTEEVKEEEVMKESQDDSSGKEQVEEEELEFHEILERSMKDLKEGEIQARLKQFKQLTQFEIELTH